MIDRCWDFEAHQFQLRAIALDWLGSLGGARHRLPTSTPRDVRTWGAGVDARANSF